MVLSVIYLNFVYSVDILYVALFEMRSLSVTLLNTYTCIFSAASLFFSFFRAKQYSRDVTVVRQFSPSFEVSLQ